MGVRKWDIDRGSVRSLQLVKRLSILFRGTRCNSITVIECESKFIRRRIELRVVRTALADRMLGIVTYSSYESVRPPNSYMASVEDSKAKCLIL
ncbi:hypothetical protein EVAR_51013_1 [Eumeta japonica]|uniref:Uncharacterized protein n=1 Tax=Eumeta variegata TaxID=151549 RepID=A0A4C1Y747_EUMVA|nr:hypothetical protein EVAR_51013_1 [Eumeta japonica]